MLKAIINTDAFEALDESVKAHYTKRDDGKSYLLAVEAVEGHGLEDVKALKNSLAHVRQERDEFRESIGDLNIPEARAALEKVEEMKDWTPEQKVQGKIDEAVLQIKNKAATDLENSAKVSDGYKQQLGEMLIHATARQALGKHELVNGGEDLLMPHIVSQTKTKEVEGRLVARIRGETEERDRVSMKQGSTDPMGVEELVGIMAEDDKYSALFKGKGESGTPNKSSESTHQLGDKSGGGKDDGKPLNPVDRLREARAAAAGRT